VLAGSSTEKGVEEYLILLSVCQTCKYMGVDFLDFLRSGEKDIHASQRVSWGTDDGNRPSSRNPCNGRRRSEMIRVSAKGVAS